MESPLTYPILATLFFVSIVFAISLVIALIVRPRVWRRHSRAVLIFSAVWFGAYFLFILLGTGPKDLSKYPPQATSPYRLPWKAGVSRFVAQGNRSFTSHRGYHMYAWDFVMPTGTEVLAAREGKVVEVEDHFDGIGLNANFVTIEHADGERSVYAHIKHGGSLVKVGDQVSQGAPIALSGMVGQAPGPHLHFYVINKEHSSSIPISFQDVPEGVPLAGHFYVSGNVLPRP